MLTMAGRSTARQAAGFSAGSAGGGAAPRPPLLLDGCAAWKASAACCGLPSAAERSALMRGDGGGRPSCALRCRLVPDDTSNPAAFGEGSCPSAGPLRANPGLLALLPLRGVLLPLVLWTLSSPSKTRPPGLPAAVGKAVCRLYGEVPKPKRPCGETRGVPTDAAHGVRHSVSASGWGLRSQEDSPALPPPWPPKAAPMLRPGIARLPPFVLPCLDESNCAANGILDHV